MNIFRYLALAFLSSLLFTACSSRPEGPAEKIGKGLDQILEGSMELDERYGTPPTPTPFPTPFTTPSAHQQKVPSDLEAGDPGHTSAEELNDPRYQDSRHDLHSDDWWNERERREVRQNREQR